MGCGRLAPAKEGDLVTDKGVTIPLGKLKEATETEDTYYLNYNEYIVYDPARYDVTEVYKRRYKMLLEITVSFVVHTISNNISILLLDLYYNFYCFLLCIELESNTLYCLKRRIILILYHSRSSHKEAIQL
jgi:hypothetical protein